MARDAKHDMRGEVVVTPREGFGAAGRAWYAPAPHHEPNIFLVTGEPLIWPVIAV